MKRILATLLVVAMVFSLAACSSKKDDGNKATSAPSNTTAPTKEEAAPTEEATEAPTEEVTEAPTEEVTEAPTEEPTEAPTEEPTEAPVEQPGNEEGLVDYTSEILANEINLTLWDIAVEGDGNRPAYDAAMADLKAKYPNVTITETVTENEAYKTKIKAAVGANELPDIFFTWAGAFLGDFVEAGKVHCLDANLQKYIDGGELPEAMLGNSTYNGGHYGVPTTMNVVGLFANMDILAGVGYDHIPATAEELEDCCNKLVANGIIPFGCSGKETWCVTEYLEPIIEKTIGAAALNDIMRNGATWNNEGVSTAVTILQGMIQAGYFDPDGIALGNEEVKANFMAGKYAFYQNGTWNCGDFSNAEKVSFNVAVGEFPVMNPANSSLGQLIGGPSDTIAVSEGPNAEAAAEYAVEFGRLICHYGYLLGSGLPAWKVWGDTSAVLPLVAAVSEICANANGYVLFGDNAMPADEANIYLEYVSQVYGMEVDGPTFIAGCAEEIR